MTRFVLMIVGGVLLRLVLAVLVGLGIGAGVGGVAAVLAVMVGNDGGAAFVRVAPWVAIGAGLLEAISSLVLWFQRIGEAWAKARVAIAEEDIERELAK